MKYIWIIRFSYSLTGFSFYIFSGNTYVLHINLLQFGFDIQPNANLRTTGHAQNICLSALFYSTSSQNIWDTAHANIYNRLVIECIILGILTHTVEKNNVNVRLNKRTLSRNKLSMCKDEVIDSSSFFMYTYKFVPPFSIRSN